VIASKILHSMFTVYYVLNNHWSQRTRVADSYLPICWCNYYIAFNLSSNV